MVDMLMLFVVPTGIIGRSGKRVLNRRVKESCQSAIPGHMSMCRPGRLLEAEMWFSHAYYNLHRSVVDTAKHPTQHEQYSTRVLTHCCFCGATSRK